MTSQAPHIGKIHARHVGSLATMSQSCQPVVHAMSRSYMHLQSNAPAPPKPKPLTISESPRDVEAVPVPKGDVPVHVSDPRRAHPDVHKTSLTLKDAYALLIALVLVLAGGPPIFVITWVLGLLPSLVCHLYVRTLPRPAMSFERTCGFHVARVCFVLSATPLIVLALIWPVVIQLVNFVACLPYVILFCRFGIVRKNFKVLAPYLHFGLWDTGDIFQGFCCSVDRHGFFRFWCAFMPQVIWQIPIAKYVLISNPWLYELAEEFINQLTTPLEMTTEEAAAGLIRVASWPLQSREDQNELKSFIFSVNYPIPAQEGATRSTGLQTPALRTIENRVMFTTVEHKHLQYTGPDCHIPARSVLSQIPVYAVSLHYLNPYHYVTAYVEVNVTKNNELEHPSWLILGKDSWLGPQLTDMTPFFLLYAPQVEGFLEDHVEDLETGINGANLVRSQSQSMSRGGSSHGGRDYSRTGSSAGGRESARRGSAAAAVEERRGSSSSTERRGSNGRKASVGSNAEKGPVPVVQWAVGSKEDVLEGVTVDAKLNNASPHPAEPQTPVPEAEATPAPAPEPTPAPTPEPAVEPAPEAIPAPSAPVPEATAEPTPEPEPTAEPTPAPSAPEPEAAPEPETVSAEPVAEPEAEAVAEETADATPAPATEEAVPAEESVAQAAEAAGEEAV